MTLEKMELKKQILQELGRKLSGEEQTANQDAFRIEGAITLLKEVLPKGVESIKEFWKKELDEEKLDQDTYTQVERVIFQFEGSFRNLVLQHEELLKATRGSHLGIHRCLAALEKEFVEASNGVEGIVGIEVDETTEASKKDRKPGEHPGPGIPQIREALKAKTEEAEDELPEPVSLPLVGVDKLPAPNPASLWSKKKKNKNR